MKVSYFLAPAIIQVCISLNTLPTPSTKPQKIKHLWFLGAWGMLELCLWTNSQKEDLKEGHLGGDILRLHMFGI